MRTFVAIEIPGELSAALATLDPGWPGLRWIPPGTLHLTLNFVGGIPQAAMPPLGQRLAQVAHEPFPLALRGLGCFGGNKGRPLVIWAGVQDPEGLLAALQQKVTNAIEAAGHEVDRRRFRPHVTLTRAKGRTRSDFARQFGTAANVDFGSFEVTDFLLLSSRLTPQGAIHRTERTIPLRR